MSTVGKTTVALGLAALAATLSPIAILQAQPSRYDALANAPMKENRPTPDTAAILKDELLFQRATQTYLWAMPLINTLGMKVGSEKVFGAGYNVLPVWKKRLDAKTLVTTPNSDVIYAMSYLDLGKDGPMVFEAPRGCRASSSTSGSVRFQVRRSTDMNSSATSACPDLMRARAAIFSSCRRATRAKCRKGISSIGREPTTSLCSCVPSIRTRLT
jgi:Protein of unknown function (DUF1254)